MPDKLTRKARALAARAETWADLAADRHNAAYDQDGLASWEAWAGCVGIGLVYAAASVALTFTQDDE